jgi:ABC-type multidrug transport system permease subunit
MFQKLKVKWKVESNLQLFLILCTFAITGSLTAFISREITAWVGFTESTFWLWKFLLRLSILLFGYQVIILAVSLLLGQFRFFWNYEKKILLWMGILKNSKPQSSSKSSHVTQAMQVIKD